MKRKFVSVIAVIAAALCVSGFIACNKDGVYGAVAGKTFVAEEVISVSYAEDVSEEVKAVCTASYFDDAFSGKTVVFGADGKVGGTLSGVLFADGAEFQQDGGDIVFSASSGGALRAVLKGNGENMELTVQHDGVTVVVLFVLQEDSGLSVTGDWKLSSTGYTSAINGQVVSEDSRAVGDIVETASGGGYVQIAITEEMITFSVYDDGTCLLVFNDGEDLYNEMRGVWDYSAVFGCYLFNLSSEYVNSSGEAVTSEARWEGTLTDSGLALVLETDSTQRIDGQWVEVVETSTINFIKR